jgi:hypothetical protein
VKQHTSIEECSDRVVQSVYHVFSKAAACVAKCAIIVTTIRRFCIGVKFVEQQRDIRHLGRDPEDGGEH